MDNKTLMIGDWIRIGDADKYHGWLGVIRAINNITGYCIVALINNEGRISISNVFIDDIEPIPLTPEILEKNGFHTNYDHTLLGSCIYRRMCGKYNEYEVVVRMLNGWIKIKSHDDRVTDILTIDFQPRFVHQLQHALRLCGLNELADNFIIE